MAKRPKNIAIFIGPEGGFSEKEKEQMIKSGAQAVSLGKNILRTETAAIVSIAMLVYEFEL